MSGREYKNQDEFGSGILDCTAVATTPAEKLNKLDPAELLAKQEALAKKAGIDISEGQGVGGLFKTIGHNPSGNGRI